MKKQKIQAITEFKDGQMTAVASTEDVDRSGDSLKVEDWDLKNFKKNPVLQAGHDYRPEFTIGVAENIRVEGKKLLFEPKFHDVTELARDIKKMFQEKFLKAWSVGFIPAEEEDGKNELLEVSAVSVPANAMALMKGHGAEKYCELIKKFIKETKETKNGDEDEEKKVEEKSPACRQEDETKAECVARKIPELIEEEEMEQDQAIAVANSVCEEKCETKESKKDNDEEFIDEEEEEATEAEKDEKKTETKEDVQKETGETDGHRHLAVVDDESGNGKTSVENEHFHQVANFLILEENGHTHTLDLEAKSGHDKKPKKDVEFVERWNKTLPEIFNKAFDINNVPSKPASYRLSLYTKYLGCKVKNIYSNSYLIPSPLLGSYLAGFKELTKDFKLVDERNFTYGGELPLTYETIQLNSEETDDFLIEGTRFYENDIKHIISFYPTWCGLIVEFVSKNTDKNFIVNLLKDAHKWVEKNNKLKGEIFGLSDEFINKTEDSWEDMVLPKEISEPVQKGLKRLNDKKEKAKSRGLLFVGPPGTGKTRIGKIMMNDLDDSTFIWVSSRDFARLSPVQALKLSFDLARKLAPSILFMEDIDMWLKEYAIDLLKTEMDGIKENKGMITILTSNNPETLPDALLDRPGRFHDVLEFGLPDAELRAKMIIKWAGKIGQKVLDEIVEQTKDYSGAHMKELVEFAQMIVEDDEIKIDEALLKSLDKLKRQRELVQEIKKKEKPQINEQIETREDIEKGVEIKEGRVLSTKSRRIIKGAIQATENATNELKGLMELNEKTPEDEKPKKSVKVNYEAEILKKTMQLISKASNRSLAKTKC